MEKMDPFIGLVYQSQKDFRDLHDSNLHPLGACCFYLGKPNHYSYQLNSLSSIVYFLLYLIGTQLGVPVAPKHPSHRDLVFP
jgi:hypothetical protein